MWFRPGRTYLVIPVCNIYSSPLCRAEDFQVPEVVDSLVSPRLLDDQMRTVSLLPLKFGKYS
jgi:hypothetical protein